MNNPNLVRPRQGVGNLRRDGDCLAKRNGAGHQRLSHRFTTNQFHGDEVRVFHTAELINGDNIRVVKRGGGTGFRLKAGQGFRMRMMPHRNRLNCDFTPQTRVAGAVNFAHTSGPESLEDFVGAEARSRQQRRGK